MKIGRNALEMKKPLGPLPMNTRQLVVQLRECFPPLQVSPGMGLEAVMFAAGAREVVTILEEALSRDPSF